MRDFLAVLLLVASPGVTAAVHGPAAHGGASHEAHAPAPAFDEKHALKVSQGVLGKGPRDAMLTRADGTTVRLSDYRGKPLVVSLIYTSCYHICPTTTQHLAKVARTARAALGTDSFRVLTIGFDTPKDTPQAMARFAREQRVDLPGWDFASADAATLKQLVEDVGFLYFPAAQGFDHLIQATVLDADGKIYRQVYGMTFDTPLLVEPLKELVFGEPRTASFLESVGNRIKLFCTVYDPATDRYRFDYSIFIGGVIGLTGLGLVAFLVVREWRRRRPTV
ncbi:MAG: SCO family protein [Gammaproteobacteria bacterium]|nr:MAG: SCO family protein [Gammaproteobacteria bacterium]